MSHSDPWVAFEHVFSLVNVSAVTDILTGGWHRGSAPPKKPDGMPVEPPYGTINLVPMQDLQIVNGIRIWAEVLVDVVGIGTELQTDALDRALAIYDPLLHATDGSTTSGRVFSCQRIRPIFFEDVDEGIRYVYVGGSYRVTARAT